jgi:hypothetical protein
MRRDLLLIAGAFVLASAVPRLAAPRAPASALAFGQIALAACVVFVLLRH